MLKMAPQHKKYGLENLYSMEVKTSGASQDQFTTSTLTQSGMATPPLLEATTDNPTISIISLFLKPAISFLPPIISLHTNF